MKNWNFGSLLATQQNAGRRRFVVDTEAILMNIITTEAVLYETKMLTNDWGNVFPPSTKSSC